MRLFEFLGTDLLSLFETEYLTEDYGNLKSIPKTLLKVFHVGTEKSDTDLAAVGQYSTIEPIPQNKRRGIKTFDYFWKAFESSSDAIGVVVEINGKKCITFAQLSKMDKKGKFNVAGKAPSDIEDTFFEGGVIQAPASMLRRALDNIVKQCVENDIEVFASLITADTVRAGKQASRKDAQTGVVPLPGDRGYNTYVTKLTADLKSKLKSTKVNELTDSLKRNGALATFEYSGLTYSKYVTKIDLSSLADGEEAYIEYKANRDELRKYLNDGGSAPAYVRVILKQGRNALSLDIARVEMK